MTIIGLLGKAYSGKSTIANYLFKEHDFRVFSFSKPVKEIAMDYFGISYEEAYQTKPPHVRTILQGIGSFIKECIDKDYFLFEMLKRIKYSETKKIVIDDVRFLEEAQLVKDLDGIIVKIECPDSPYRLTKEAQGHESEQIDAIPYDYLISVNYGKIEKIKHAIEQIIKAE